MCYTRFFKVKKKILNYFKDLFSIGDISAYPGNAFGCADPKLWYNTPQMSASQLSIAKQTLKYDYLVNTDGKM